MGAGSKFHRDFYGEAYVKGTGKRAWTEPAKVRNGKTHPGGRAMRRGLKKLEARRNAFVGMRDSTGHTKPGSVK